MRMSYWFYRIPSYFMFYLSSTATKLIVLQDKKENSLICRSKSVVDFSIALLLLPAAAPIIAFTALLIKLTSPGPVFYTQTRLGLNGRRYRIIKLRTMHYDCE